ncbi:MAG: tetratricopeptide repeat protein, partial [Oscillospiraceae bacterium]|nr:tetratricopeptide repeat protein [Oscillospiraceae bacterium]
QQGRITDAEELLDGTPMQARDAEWYFLKGNIYFQRGWLDDALNHFSTACRLSPNNPEYRAAMNRMMWQRQGNFGSPNGGYRTSGSTGGCSGCDMCSGLLCADCCCECMGGDLISCC